jgi:hypothetical protein
MSDEMKATVLSAVETSGKTLSDPCLDPLAQFQPLCTPFFNTATSASEIAICCQFSKLYE